MNFTGRYLLLVVTFLLCIGHAAVAQITTPKSANVRLDEIMRSGLMIGPDRYVDIVGNPFIEEEFQVGEVIHMDSTITHDVLMRLNHHTDEIEFMLDDEIMVFSKPRQIDHVTFGHRSFAYFDFIQKKKKNAGYFEVLAWGNTKLLLRRNTMVKREDLPPSDMSGGNYRDYFRTTEEYFLKKGDALAVQIQKGARSILKVLEDHEEELSNFINENKLRLRSEEEMIDLIYFYNSISQNE